MMSYGAIAAIILANLSPAALAGNCASQQSGYPLCLCVPNQGCAYHCEWEATNILGCAKFSGADAGTGSPPNPNQVFLDCDDSKVDTAVTAYGDCSAPKEGNTAACNYAKAIASKCSNAATAVPAVPGCFYDSQ